MNRVFTAGEVQRAQERGVRDFDLLWKATSQVRPHSPVRAMSGTYMKSAILSRRGDMVVMRPYVIPKDPKTAAQLRKRENMRVACQAWLALTAAQRNKWQPWAVQHRHFPDARTFPRGVDIFRGAVITTRMMGISLPELPPAGPPPPAVSKVTQEPAASDDCFSFRIRHGVTKLTGMRLMVEITDQMPTIRRKPQHTNLRLFSSDDAASFVPLQADGALYQLEDAQFAVQPGGRYGVRFTIVAEQGVRGQSVMLDFIKPPVAAAEPSASSDAQQTNAAESFNATSTAAVLPALTNKATREIQRVYNLSSEEFSLIAQAAKTAVKTRGKPPHHRKNDPVALILKLGKKARAIRRRPG